MKEKFLLLGCFLVFVPALILIEALLLTKLNPGKINGGKIASISVFAEEEYPLEGSVFSSSEAAVSGQIKGNVVVADARPLLIERYLAKYNSPLTPFADLIFETSQKYALDYRLIVAIAQQESNLCRKMPPNCINCWGVGIHSRGTMCFNSYPEAIEWFAKYLKEEYFDKGLTTPEEIMKKYCPLSNGSWAFGINQFLDELD